MSDANVFSNLSDDVVMKILFNLEDDPRNWARLACVSTKFSSLIRNFCWKIKCSQTIPSVVSDLFSTTSPVGRSTWPSLHKLAVCCPGLSHAGVLLQNSDFGLGPNENCQSVQSQSVPYSSSLSNQDANSGSMIVSGSDCGWSLSDDLCHETTLHNDSEASSIMDGHEMVEKPEKGVVKPACDFSVCKRRKICRSLRSHLASGVWSLSREQGNKLLGSRFKGDCLYICDWPGCVHIEEKRNYMLFRGIFKNFKQSRVWRTINDNDGNKRKIDLSCAFCACKQTWDLHSAFCLRRYFGFHEDGEPHVRAYVCENGHVSGAWTDWPLYT